ncbi:MAG TPA: hypothetical protein VEA18_01360 [Candidatus Kapabacteria bacterium]|nr:hypothetical protein [Candidatus Kapabacteria bacterium]
MAALTPLQQQFRNTFSKTVLPVLLSTMMAAGGISKGDRDKVRDAGETILDTIEQPIDKAIAEQMDAAAADAARDNIASYIIDAVETTQQRASTPYDIQPEQHHDGPPDEAELRNDTGSLEEPTQEPRQSIRVAKKQPDTPEAVSPAFIAPGKTADTPREETGVGHMKQPKQEMEENALDTLPTPETPSPDMPAPEIPDTEQSSPVQQQSDAPELETNLVPSEPSTPPPQVDRPGNDSRTPPVGSWMEETPTEQIVANQGQIPQQQAIQRKIQSIRDQLNAMDVEFSKETNKKISPLQQRMNVFKSQRRPLITEKRTIQLKELKNLIVLVVVCFFCLVVMLVSVPFMIIGIGFGTAGAAAEQFAQRWIIFLKKEAQFKLRLSQINMTLKTIDTSMKDVQKKIASIQEFENREHRKRKQPLLNELRNLQQSFTPA